MDGNYTKSMPQRFARATSIIKIEMNRFGALYRFIKRYFKGRNNPSYRIGAPEHIQEKFNWTMAWLIIKPRTFGRYKTPREHMRAQLLTEHAHKIITIRSFKEMDTLFPS